jgi:hypothetical protein
MKALKVFEKFVEDSDPIKDLSIGTRALIKKVKALILEILEADSENEVDEWQEEDNLDIDRTYKIIASMDIFGMSDVCEYTFEYDANTEKAELTVYEVDGYNRRKWDFTLKKKLKDFANMTKLQYLDNYYYKKEKKLTKYEAEEIGY